MGSLIFILAPILGAMSLAMGFAIALGVVAARADAHCERMLAEERARIPIRTPIVARDGRERGTETQRREAAPAIGDRAAGEVYAAASES